ncbi:MAG: hypothetical protein CEE38_15125 [Planctomycetes bacterium B3_Pla]|nr:MAG: hypothetical protein CEE38_15125 [Planctomycetes bacterium B3_Pla]
MIKMISYNSRSNCASARQYYFDLLDKGVEEDVPESVIRHVDSCRRCKADIGRLGALLAGTGNAAQSQKDLVISELLSLHFAWIGKSVTCRTVKPFLPSLADPMLQISIPTPVTVHLDNCRACSEELSTFRNLGFTHTQLCRLGQFIAEKPADGCSQAQAAIPAVAGMVFGGTDAEVLEHLCTCPDCRELLYQYRESARSELTPGHAAQKELSCKEVSEADIFEHCFPYGIDPAGDRDIEFRESVALHLRSCPTCLAKIQQLHAAVYSIAERPDSGVATRFTFRGQTGHGAGRQSGRMYADWPVDVQVFEQEDPVDTRVTEAAPEAVSPEPKQKVSVVNLQRYLKPAIAAAAVILIGFAFFFGTPAAKAIDLNQIYRAIGIAGNIHVSIFDPGGTEPKTEEWASSSLGIYMSKVGQELTLWDFRAGPKKVKSSRNVAPEAVPFTEAGAAAARRRINSPLGIVPFDNMSEVPPDAIWNRVADDTLQSDTQDSEVYDLTWTERGSRGQAKLKKWRVFVDPGSNLPRKAQFYKKSPTDTEPILENELVVEYLNDLEVEAAVKEASL